jgi:hypothetical protein
MGLAIVGECPAVSVDGLHRLVRPASAVLEVATRDGDPMSRRGGGDRPQRRSVGQQRTLSEEPLRRNEQIDVGIGGLGEISLEPRDSVFGRRLQASQHRQANAGRGHPVAETNMDKM